MSISKYSGRWGFNVADHEFKPSKLTFSMGKLVIFEILHEEAKTEGYIVCIYIFKFIPCLSSIISRYDFVIHGPVIPILDDSVPTIYRRD